MYAIAFDLIISEMPLIDRKGRRYSNKISNTLSTDLNREIFKAFQQQHGNIENIFVTELE